LSVAYSVADLRGEVAQRLVQFDNLLTVDCKGGRHDHLVSCNSLVF
jgi:hypothetical protein